MKNIEAIVEIPANTKNKFEVDHKTRRIRLDRVLYSAMSYPCEYGYIDETLELDGDPLDILIISSEPTFPGCIVPVRVIGNLRIIDNGTVDNKIISVVAVDPRFNEMQDINDLSSFLRKEIKNFFENYKELQRIKVDVRDYQDKNRAMKIIEECRRRYRDSK
ncbi:inorganic diphosphatase [bacterium]|nr:inorganic diphosphatase [bacterium]